jgi:DNA-binding XRE family transcriptional regulator
MSEMQKLTESLLRGEAKEFADPEHKVERLRIEGRDFVLMRSEVYEQLLREIEELDSALDLQRSQATANLGVARRLLSGNYSAQQIREIVGATTPAERFSLMRNYLNLNQAELAGQAGVSQSTISKIERGQVKFRTVDSARRILSALGADEADMLDLLAENEAEDEGSAEG